MPGSKSTQDEVLFGKEEVAAAKYKTQINTFRRPNFGAPPTFNGGGPYSFRPDTGYRAKGKGKSKGKGSWKGRGFGFASGRGKGRAWGMSPALEGQSLFTHAQGELFTEEGEGGRAPGISVSGCQGVPNLASKVLSILSFSG